MLLIILWISNAWFLWNNHATALPLRQVGIVFMVIMGIYMSNAMFHDTSIIDWVNILVFFLAGAILF